MTEYTLAQAADRAAERRRLELIQSYQDPPTIRGLAAAGVTEGWRCLDVGAGGGSITRWLAQRVGPGGSVVATDLDTTLLSAVPLPNLTVWRHDVRTDPLPVAEYDLVHLRLLLTHLPEREDVLARLVRALRPGGRLVAGDIDFSTLRLGRPDVVFDRVLAAFDRAVRGAGWDPATGRHLPALLECCGLRGVDAECEQRYQYGGPASAIFAMTCRRLRPLLLAEGVSEDELEHALALLDNPGVALYGPTMWTVWGRTEEG